MLDVIVIKILQIKYKLGSNELHYLKFSKKIIILSILLLQTITTADATTNNTSALVGLWMETTNFPASSIIRFSKDGKKFVGKYAQVSSEQKEWGFSVGETIIRGTIKNGVFEGEVLLKPRAGKKENCLKELYGWRRIEMKLKGANRLEGAWLQSLIDCHDSCTVIGEAWQDYAIEKLRVK
jgi:hypothetical protein